MTTTIDRKVAIGLLSKATTGNDLLSVLDMITSTFTESTTPTPMATQPSPTIEEMEF